MDLNQILKVLKAAAKTVQDIKGTAAPSALIKSNARDSYEMILEQYCIKNRFQWSRDATGNTRNSFMHHIVADFFRLDIHIINGTVADVWVLHQLRGHKDACPQLARALRLKDMSQFDLHMNGLLKMYTTSADKAKRLHFFMSLNALENDLTLVHQHLMEYHMEPMELIRSGPFGLMVPRMEGIPFSLGFFVAPSDLMERNGSLMKKEYHVIAGRRLGLWASISVKASKALSATLPMSTVYRKMSPTVDGNIICDFATVKESGGHDVPGSFVLALDQPMVLVESAIIEIKQITEMDLLHPLPKTSNSASYVGALRSIYLPDETMEGGEEIYRVILPGQHHVYTLVSGDISVVTTTEIPFSHPSQIPPLLNVLRRQAALNKLLSSCMRVVSENEVVDPFAFRIVVVSARFISVEFNHPLNSSFTKVEIRLDDMGTPSCELVDCNPRLCRDQQASVWLNKTFSIPVVLKTMIDRFVESYITPSCGLTRVVETPKKAAPIAITPLSFGPGHSDATTSFMSETTTRPLPVEVKIEPIFTQSGPISPVKPSSKIERMLKEGKSSASVSAPSSSVPPNFAKDKSSVPVVKDIPMDQELHAKKMKELYDTNPKKKLRKQDVLEQEFAEKEAAKLKKRRVSAALTPPGSVPLPTPIKTESQDFIIENQPKSEPPVTKIRTGRTDSPHGSPITLKFSTIKQPSSSSSSSDTFNPNLQTVLLNKDSPPKKKKIKLAEMSVEQKHIENKLEAIKRVKRDVFDFDAGSDLKEVKKFKKEQTEPEIINVETPKKAKKEQLAEVDFLPKGNKKKDTDLSELASLLSKNRNISFSKSSPNKPQTSTSPSSSSNPRPLLTSSSSSSKHTSSGPTFSSSKFPHRENSSSSLKSSPQVLQIFKTATTKTPATNSSMQFSVPKSLPSGIGRIPKKNHGGAVAPPTGGAMGLPPNNMIGGATRPIGVTSATVTPKTTGLPQVAPPPTLVQGAPPAVVTQGVPPLVATQGAPSAMVAQVAPPPVVTQAAPPSALTNRERVEESSNSISALLTPSANATRAGLLPTPITDPMASWNQLGAKEKSSVEKVQPTAMPKTPTSPIPTSAISPEKAIVEAKPTSLFRQVMGTFTEASSAMSLEDEKAKKTSPDTSLIDSSTSPSIRNRNRSISAILDRLSSKTRLDTADGSHDSSDLQDVVFNGSGADVMGGVDVVGGVDIGGGVDVAEILQRPSEIFVAGSEEPEKEKNQPVFQEKEGPAIFQEKEDQLVIQEKEGQATISEKEDQPVFEEKEGQAISPTKNVLSLQTLVSYSSDDDASCDEAVLLPDLVKKNSEVSEEVTANVATVAPPPQSPEILERTPFVSQSEAAVAEKVDTSVSEKIDNSMSETFSVVSDLVNILSPRHSDDRTSPIIINDEMLDAAFFTSDEKD